MTPTKKTEEPTQQPETSSEGSDSSVAAGPNSSTNADLLSAENEEDTAILDEEGREHGSVNGASLSDEEHVAATNDGPNPVPLHENNEPSVTEKVEPPNLSSRPSPEDLRIQLLERELVEREKTLHEYIRAHKRMQAEYEAFNSRLKSTQNEEVEAAKAKMVERLLDVYDNLQRSLEATNENLPASALRDGVELVARQFLQTLEDLGLSRHDPTGEPFDPLTMEALCVVPVTNADQDGMVIATVKPGFRLEKREIRPAMVQVGRKT
jgi:molecular chaperone GrpE